MNNWYIASAGTNRFAALVSWAFILFVSILILVSPRVEAQAMFVQEGQAGFVVASISYALGKDAAETGACPNGMSETYADMNDVFIALPDLQRKQDEDENTFRRRSYAVAFGSEDVKNLCTNPELGEPNPLFRIVTGENVSADGIDIDGENTRENGQCGHQDFIGLNGESGIDNQFYRWMGCHKSFQSTGPYNSFDIEMLTGSWGILITLSDIDDVRNDDSVKVGFYANADPIMLSSTREPLANATYTIMQDERYRAETTGRLVDGVLTTDPVDMQFQMTLNSMYLERTIKDASVQMTLSNEGVLEGYLAGYMPVEELYDLHIGFRNGKNATGNLAPLRSRAGSAIGAARVLGHTCEGAYFAAYEVADAYPDPETGKCTAVSIQYRVKAIPAFVINE